MPKKTPSKDDIRRMYTDAEVEAMLTAPKRLVSQLNFDRMKREPGDPCERMTLRAQDAEGREYQLTLERNTKDPRLFSFLLEVSRGSKKIMTTIARINSQHHEHRGGGGKRHLHYYTEAQARIGRDPICNVKALSVPPQFENAARFALEYFKITQEGPPGQGPLPFSGR